MVNVGVARDKDKVKLLDASALHVLAGDGKKIRHGISFLGRGRLLNAGRMGAVRENPLPAEGVGRRAQGGEV